MLDLLGEISKFGNGDDVLALKGNFTISKGELQLFNGDTSLDVILPADLISFIFSFFFFIVFTIFNLIALDFNFFLSRFNFSSCFAFMVAWLGSFPLLIFALHTCEFVLVVRLKLNADMSKSEPESSKCLASCTLDRNF